MTEDALLVSLEERGNQMLNLQQQVLDRIRPSADREMEAFVHWVRSVILQRRCQQEISITIYRYIGENDLLKRQQPQELSQYRQSFQPRQDSSQACVNTWMSPPSQWPSRPTYGISVWHTQDANWLAQTFPQQYPQQQHRTLTQLQPAQSGCTVPGSPPLPMMTWDGVSNKPMAAPASHITHCQGENSQTTPSSLHLSDFINDNDPSADDYQQ
ncbi:hypothetical protein DPMN_097034 [Dreissena polymorpha]|uniref:Uncharacterized protein n=1 Tax=Dreissena polymorpha TaxID=45954 RepID=A0A9D4R474_DREPO|nr:hypothetical protein DPMN_097034 [Dreissena polymorpha]